MKRNNILSNILGLPWDTKPDKAKEIYMQVYRATTVEEYDQIIDQNYNEFKWNPEAVRIFLKIRDKRDPYAEVDRLIRNRRGTMCLVAVAALYTNSLICTYFVTLLHL